MSNPSPWLNFEKTTWPALKNDLKCEVAIVGAGISGVATLYYLLTSTEKQVVLLERNRVASGATGHNAGLAVVHIEKSASELTHMLGVETTQSMFTELNEAWDDLHAIHDEIGLQDNLLSFSHVANGFNSIPECVSFLKDILVRSDYHKGDWRFVVSEESKEQIPEEFSHLFEVVPRQTVLDALRTVDARYIAAWMRVIPFKGKRMNSAKFCAKVLDYLQERFPNRFSVYEETNITEIALYQDHLILKHAHGIVQAQDIILCTNAYTDFSIWDHSGNKPFTKLQESIRPRIGFLVAYPNPSPKPYAIGYLNQRPPFEEVPFWYFSCAPHSNNNPDHACVLGGPEFELEGSLLPNWVKEKEAESLQLIKEFTQLTFKEAPATFPFFWYGWMGYTQDGLRLVGPDPEQPHLWYNLACNGIGIIPAIAGAKKIARLLSLLADPDG